MSVSISTTHAAPTDQPTSVREIADRLFPAYTVDGGSVHLAGCWLEDCVFVRLAFCQDGQPGQVYIDQQGSPVEPDLVESLGMTETIRLALPPESRTPDLSRAIARGVAIADELGGAGPTERQSATVIWCKYVRGKLRFVIGERAADLAFADWARLIEPPPFVCPYSGQSTYHLAATDDGRIVAAEQIEACQETGCRMLASELVECAATGRRVAAELTLKCPVSGDHVLEGHLVECGWCCERVSPLAIEGNRCAACRRLQPVEEEDDRMVRILDVHPRLARWPKWQLSETAAVYILSTAAWLKRILAVVDKETLELKRLATGNRLSSSWQAVDPTDYAEVLGG